MKNIMMVTMTVLGLCQSADAVIRLGWERPKMRANLELVDGLKFPRALSLTLNQRDEAKEPTTFVMVEDTGIRCVTVPCPSKATTVFRIERVIPSFHRRDVVRYEAIEILKNIAPNVRLAPRRLFVTESSMELIAPEGQGFQVRTIWEVEVVSFPDKTQVYGGYPELLYTIANR